jgi:hypothetical protein
MAAESNYSRASRNQSQHTQIIAGLVASAGANAKRTISCVKYSDQLTTCSIVDEEIRPWCEGVIARLRKDKLIHIS